MYFVYFVVKKESRPELLSLGRFFRACLEAKRQKRLAFALRFGYILISDWGGDAIFADPQKILADCGVSPGMSPALRVALKPFP